LLIALLMLTLILGSITFLVNLAERDHRARWIALFGILSFIGLILFYWGGLMSVAQMPESDQLDFLEKPLDATNTTYGFTVILITLLISLFLLWEPFRLQIAPLFPPPIQPQQTTLPPVLRWDGNIELSEHHIQMPVAKQELLGFRPQSLMHTWALILMVVVFGSQIADFLAAGGLSGVSENLAVNYESLIGQFVLEITLPLLGVGLFLRRDWRSVLQRLGLGSIGIQEILVSFGITFGLWVGLIGIVIIWQLTVPPETFEQQNEASSALADSINSLGLAFMVAFTAAVGEEIIFRGAMQPIFGLWPTAIIFVVIHIQYTLTPAMLIILMVAIVLGYVRRYFNTTTAILIHFLYNFSQLVIGLVVSEAFILGIFK